MSKIFILCLLPIVSGIAIYLFARDSFIHLFIASRRVFLVLPWIAYNIPDGLWLFSFLNTLQLIWKDDTTFKYVWLISVSLLSITTEYLQFAHIIPGTYDALDVLAYLTAFIASFLLFRFFPLTKYAS